MQVATSTKLVITEESMGWSRAARVLGVSAEYLVLAGLMLLFIARGFLPAWQSLNTDFRNYYVAARLYRDGSSLLRVYDFTWFQRQKDHQGIQQCLVGFVPDTLLSALPIVPLAGLPPLAAKRGWLIVNAVFLTISAWILMQVTQLGWRRILLVVFLAIEPLGKNFLYGQMHLFVFFLLATAFWFSERGRPEVGGVCVALAAGLKLYPVLFLAFFIRKKQWRAAAGMTVGLIALAVLSVYLFGWDVHRIYLREILPPIGRGENIDPYAPGWNSLTALLHRAFIGEPELNPHPLFSAPILYALVQPLSQAAIFLPAVWLLVPGAVPRAHARLEWAAFVAMLMALSTGPLSYHLCVLILAAALGLDALLAANRRREACALMALYAVICLPWMSWATRNADGWHLLTASPRVLPLLALPYFLYRTLYRLPLVRCRSNTHRGERWVLGAAFIVLAVVGMVQTVRHGQGEFANYSRRLFALPGTLLKGEPSVTADGLFFIKMPGNNPSFELWRRPQGQLPSLLHPEDEFHPASAPGLHDVWVESAGPASNIARLSSRASGGVPTAQIEVVNGEQPTVSPDGKWLAFIRETRGRGALWIKEVASNAISPATERRVVQDSFDVWEAAFEPGDRRLVFTAAPDGSPALYFLDLASGRITRTPIAGPARYPAFSPDARWLAYSRCERGSWHLYVTDLSAGSTRPLEQGDCNSISPVWERDSKGLIYATDCGRGLEMTALVRVEVLPEDREAAIRAPSPAAGNR